MNYQFTAIFEEVPEGFIGYVAELPGANTQAPTLEQARQDLAEAVQLVIEANRALAEQRLVGRRVVRELLSVEVRTTSQ
jgi:predicted RNase H-like HicB family nuclease